LKAVPVISDLLQLGIDLYEAVNDTVNTYQGLKNTAEANNAAGDAYRKAAAMYNQKVDEYNKFYESCDGTDQTPPLAPPPYGRTGSATHQNTAEEAKDPNDKVTAGFSPAGWIADQTPIPYVIHFENLAAAGLPAQRVVVTDVLDENLDRSTFELWEIGFNNTAFRVPGGLQQYVIQVAVPTDPNPVKVEVAFDAGTGGITWSMTSLDPATGGLVADLIAGFLPPNDATHRGEGWLTFAVRPKAGLATGTEIRNRARIVFDANDPIDTNEVLNTIDADSPTAVLAGLAPGATVKDWQLNARGYLDVTFSDLGSGLNQETILDSQAEFVLSGAGAAGVAVNGAATLVDGTTNTYRYTFTGAFSNGPVSVEFAAGAFGDNVGNSNQAATQSFTVRFEPSFWIDTPQPVLEGNKKQKTLNVPVRLTGPIGRAVTVRYVTANGSAIAGKDYQPVRGTLTFSPKKPLTQTIKVPIFDDKLHENTETFQINLSLPKKSKAAVPIAVGAATGTILEGDPMPKISIRDVLVREGKSGTTKATFVVSLSGKSSLRTTVEYATADGSATVADGDYRAAIGTLTFAPGVTQRTITVLVNGDKNFETSETFQVNLSNPANATLARPSGTGTIKNDDRRPAVASSDATINERDGGLHALPASVLDALAADHYRFRTRWKAGKTR
jgi:hypothetical protein